MTAVHFYRLLTLLSFFGLMITYLLWILIAPHAETYPTAAMLLFGVVPLLFPLRGLLYGRPYTHAWTSFLMLFYFMHSIGEFYSAESFSPYALAGILFSFSCFSATIVFVKMVAKQRHNKEKQA